MDTELLTEIKNDIQIIKSSIDNLRVKLDYVKETVDTIKNPFNWFFKKIDDVYSYIKKN